MNGGADVPPLAGGEREREREREMADLPQVFQ